MKRLTSWWRAYGCNVSPRRRAAFAIVIATALVGAYLALWYDWSPTLSASQRVQIETFVEDVGSAAISAELHRALKDGRLSAREAARLIELAKGVDPDFGLITPIIAK